MTRIPMIGIASRWRGTRIGSMAVSLLLAEAITKARGAGIEATSRATSEFGPVTS